MGALSTNVLAGDGAEASVDMVVFSQSCSLAFPTIVEHRHSPPTLSSLLSLVLALTEPAPLMLNLRDLS